MSKRSAYIEKMGAQLRLWDAQINELSAKADKKKADVKIGYYDLVNQLNKKRDSAQKKLKELQNAGEDGWENLRNGVDSSWKDLKDSVDKAVSKFK